MADRREQNEAASEFRRVERHRQAKHAGERMDDDDRLLDAAVRQRRAQRRGLAGGRGGVRASEAVAPAVAGTIDGEHAKTEGGQAFAQSDVQVGEIARGAVDEQNGAALGRARRPFDDMDCGAARARGHAFADRRKTRFDDARRERGEGQQAGRR